MVRADISNAIREAGQKDYFQLDKSSSMSRLQELGVNVGVARKKQHKRRNSRLVNQDQTGMISRSTSGHVQSAMTIILNELKKLNELPIVQLELF